MMVNAFTAFYGAIILYFALKIIFSIIEKL